MKIIPIKTRSLGQPKMTHMEEFYFSYEVVNIKAGSIINIYILNIKLFSSSI